MVAGKVKAAMGFHRSPATPKAAETPTRTPCSHHRSHPSPSANSSGSKVTVFSRSFGVYFPRSSAQIQPRPPPDELLRLVDELQERESRLRTELLEYKILKETVAIVPFLESQITAKDEELDRSAQRSSCLEAEIEDLKSRIRREEEEGRRKERRIEELEAEIEEMKRTASEIESSRRLENDECSSSQRFQGLIDASARSNLLRSFRKAPKSTDIAPNPEIQKPEVADPKGDDGETEQSHPSPCESEREREEGALKPRAPRVPKPPPKPSNSSSSSSITATSETSVDTSSRTPASGARPPPPPPPPPPPVRGARMSVASVRRVPEVVEFYHSLMRRDSKRESGGGGSDGGGAASNARSMIGEIENRSAHLLAIKTDVETQGDFIRFLINEVNNAAFTNIEDVVAFVKWLDDELSFLVDERAVLKHFDWPERKADAMREAAFGYFDLKKLEAEALCFVDDHRQTCTSALKKMQVLLEKLEHGVYNLSRVRDGATKRYKGFHIPWEWMLENGFVSQQIKLASVKLAIKYIKRVSSELEATGGGPEEEELMLQGVRFAFRVHQFAGGFDVETMRAFQQLRVKASSLQDRNQHQHQQKLLARSIPY